MKRAVVLVVALLSSAVVGALFVNLGEANFMPPDAPPPIVTVQLPENKVYTENSIPVAFTVEMSPCGPNVIGDFTYTLDGATRTLLNTEVSGGPQVYSCKSALSGLSEGTHSLGIAVSGAYYGVMLYGVHYYVDVSGGSDMVVFIVNTAEPRVSVLSPKPSKTYNATALSLDFTVSEPTASLSYSLDGGASVPIAGNTTLSGLAEGTHTVVVEAEDLAGSVGSSSPVTFTVETAGTEQPGESQPEPFPTTLVAAAVIVSVAAVSFGLVAYLLRRKKRRSGET
jgi:hypothetical protein